MTSPTRPKEFEMQDMKSVDRNSLSYQGEEIQEENPQGVKDPFSSIKNLLIGAEIYKSRGRVTIGFAEMHKTTALYDGLKKCDPPLITQERNFINKVVAQPQGDLVSPRKFRIRHYCPLPSEEQSYKPGSYFINITPQQYETIAHYCNLDTKNADRLLPASYEPPVCVTCTLI